MRLLLPLAWLYGVGVFLRNLYYDRVTPKRLDVPVVSVGNLTVGGTGKTPLVELLAKRLLARGTPVAVLSRGYGREGHEPFVLVADGEKVLVGAREGGDEPVELARKVPGLVVAVGADRVEAGRMLLERCGPRVVILDDGFQHRRLHRDLDIVCFDCGEKRHRLLPAGRMREPLSSLNRADAVVLTRWREGCVVPNDGGLRCVTRVRGFTRLDADEEPLAADAFRDEPVAMAVGVARPERVRESLDARVVLCETRRDHYRWHLSELEAIVEHAKAKGARALLTTGKDAVKIDSWSSGPLPVYRIDIQAEILDVEALEALLGRVPAL